MARRAQGTELLLVVSIATWSLVSRAQVIERFSIDQRGDFALIGNTLAQDCALLEEPDVGEVGACGGNADDTGSDVLWSLGEDGGEPLASTAIDPEEAASIAVLELPAGARVTRAELFWSAQSGAGDPTAATFGRGAAALEISADRTSNATTDDSDFYQSSADVTDLVRELGPGPYRLGGIDVIDPVGVSSAALYAGWWLVAFYELDSEPVRHLALYDAFAVVEDDQPTSATLTGFEVPASASDGRDAKLGVIGFDGDADAGGDQLRFGAAAPLPAAAALGGDGFFDASRRSASGAPLSVAGDQPRLSGASGSLSGLDLHVVDVGGALEPGQTSAAVLATTSSDRFFLSGFVLSLATASPDLSLSTESVRDADGPPLRPGDELEYAITVQNSGSGAALSVTLSAPLPAQVRYVPGSLELRSEASVLALTDDVDGDAGEIDRGSGETVIVRVGEGASSDRGGRLDAGTSTVISYRVVLEPGASGEIASQAWIGIERPSGAGGALVTPTDADPATPGAAVTTIRVDDCALDSDCGSGRCDESASPPRCVACLADADCPGLSPTCDGAGACVCVPAEGGTELACDGRDDDCDGAIDEDLAGVPCDVGEGACRTAGVTACAADGGVLCEPSPDAALPDGCGPVSACSTGAGACLEPSEESGGGAEVTPVGGAPAAAAPEEGALEPAAETPSGVDARASGEPSLQRPAPDPSAAASLGGGGGSCHLIARNPRTSAELGPWIGLGLSGLGLSRRARRRDGGRRR